jgi:hypothetical protein
MSAEQISVAKFPMIKREDAQLFLHVLDPQADRFTFQLFDDDRDRKDKNLTRVLHGTLDEHYATLVEYSRRGAGVFVTINETNVQRRTAADIIRIRANFTDLDGAPLTNLKQPMRRPHMIVLTSPNKFHVYWLVKGATLAQFKETQKRLAKLLGGDPNVCDLSRVMRLPGFPHQKQPDKPFLVSLFTCEFPPYSDADFQAALGAAEAIHLPCPDVRGRGSVGGASTVGPPGPPDMTQGSEPHLARAFIEHVAVNPRRPALGNLQIEPAAVGVHAGCLRSRHFQRGEPSRRSCHLPSLQKPTRRPTIVLRIMPKDGERVQRKDASEMPKFYSIS